jgi:hypothetical protein
VADGPAIGAESRRRYRPVPDGCGVTLASLLVDNAVITSTAVVRTSVLNEAGIFNERPSLLAMEDYDLWLRIAACSEVGYLQEPLVEYRDAPEASVRGRLSRADYWQGQVEILEALVERYGDRQAFPRSTALHEIRKRRSELAMVELRSGARGKAFRILGEMWRRRPAGLIELRLLLRLLRHCAS